jgi:hypothetical protein
MGIAGWFITMRSVSSLTVGLPVHLQITDPNQGSLCFLINLTHERNLEILFHDVILVDAYSVDPDQTILFLQAQSAQTLSQMLGDSEDAALVEQDATWFFQRTPAVRHCLKRRRGSQPVMGQRACNALVICLSCFDGKQSNLVIRQPAIDTIVLFKKA